MRRCSASVCLRSLQAEILAQSIHGLNNHARFRLLSQHCSNTPRP